MTATVRARVPHVSAAGGRGVSQRVMPARWHVYTGTDTHTHRQFLIYLHFKRLLLERLQSDRQHCVKAREPAKYRLRSVLNERV